MKANYSLYTFPIFFGLLFLLFSCSTVKYVPENEYLLNKATIKVNNKDIEKEELNSFLRQKENLRILGVVNFHLWLYSRSPENKPNSWFRKIGEAPVIYNEGLTERSKTQLIQYLHNKGYYNAQVIEEVAQHPKKPKVNVVYNINAGEPYRIRKINYPFSDSTLRNLFFEAKGDRWISAGQIFDIDQLDKNRQKITDLFKNHGYYYFDKNTIYYLADTTYYTNEVDLELHFKQSDEGQTLENNPYETVSINKINIHFSPNTSDRFGPNLLIDTFKTSTYTLYLPRKYKYKPDFFEGFIKVNPGEKYKLNTIKQTFNGLNRLRQFRFININFDKPDIDVNNNSLDCNINIAPLNKQSTSFDIEGTNTSGNLGIAGNLNYQHRNLFHRAEVLKFNIKGAMERQLAVVENESKDFNTREFGVEGNFIVPKLIGPGNFLNYFNDFLPQTIFTAGYNYQKRPDYTRTITNFKIGYDWKTSEFVRHTWNVVDFNKVSLYQFEPSFINSIKDLYIKSSFTDHLVFATNYTYLYNNQKINEFKNYSYFRVSFESAGNVLDILSNLVGSKSYSAEDSLGLGEINYQKVLNTRYAQYLKTDIEVRKGYIVDKYNSVVWRAFLGVGVPYGNFDVLPFEKKYFTGGANGIRAWQVRSLGPGTYKVPINAYPNQSSDIKIEANIEYRFKLIKMLEAALFLDVGNIWAINSNDNRPGATFLFDKFYKQFAVGTGTGLRFDFTYFIFRLDLGMKVRDPAQDLGNGWIIGNRKLKNDDFNISFAIGYPF